MKRLSFPLIVALSIATGAYAGDDSSNHGQAVAEEVRNNTTATSSGSAQNTENDLASALAHLYKTSAAYKTAWRNPQKPVLLTKLYANFDAAMAVHRIKSKGATPSASSKAAKEISAYFDIELDRVEEYFEDLKALEKLEDRFNGLLADMRIIDEKQSVAEMRRALEKKHDKAEDLLSELKQSEGFNDFARKLSKTRQEILEAIARIEFVRERHEKGAEKVAGRGNAAIDTHGTCQIITNENGQRLFVSTFTKDEWSGEQGFLNNLPDNVSAASCPPPPSSGGGDDNGKPNYRKPGYDLGDGKKGKCDDDKCD